MHQLCSKARLAKFAGTRVERDFVEAPSQMLENWCWQPEVLTRLSRHHVSGAALPSTLLEALVKTKTVHASVGLMRQIYLGDAPP